MRKFSVSSGLLLCTAVSICMYALPATADAALSRTNLGAFKTNGEPYGTGSFVTSSFTPVTNSLLVVVVAAQEDGANTIQPSDFTISGGGLIFNMGHSGRVVSGWDHAIAIYTASVTSGNSMTLTVDAGAKSIRNYQVQVFNYTGADRLTPIGATAFTSDTSGGGAWSTSLNVPPALTSEVLAFGHMDTGTGPTITVGTGWTEHYDEWTSFLQLQAQTRTNSASTEVRWEDIGAGFGRMGIAVEIRSGKALAKPPNNLGLVGYWSLNEGTGTQAGDFSGNANTGTFSASGITWATGKRGKALSFDGNGKLTTTDLNNAVDGVSRMTLSAWVRASPLVPHSCWICKHDATTGWYFGTQNDGVGQQVFFWTDADATNGASVPASSHRAGVWEHWVVVYDGTQASQNNRISMYKDGTLLTETPINTIDATLLSNAANLTFGQADGASYFEFEGDMDEVRVYNRALSASEALALSRAGHAKFTTSSVTLQQGSTLANGLVGHWTFDGADITDKVYDRSGNANHGYFDGVATSASKTIGKLGQAALFVGEDYSKYITVAESASYKPAGDLSIAVWIRPSVDLNDTTGCPFYSLLSTDNDFVSGYNPAINGCVGGNMTLSLGDGVEEEVSLYGDNIEWDANRWYHLTYVFDRANYAVSFYRDGVSVGFDNTGNNTTQIQGDGRMTIGAGVGGNGRGVPGGMDDLRIYSRMLTAAEVKQLYNLGRVTVE